MKEIELTQSYKALVDDEDFERLSRHLWTYGNDYAKRTTRMSEFRKRKTVRMSQEILGIAEWVDHKDGNGLNNQKANLRPCNNSQNQQNKRKTGNKTSSKYKGVCAADGKWRAMLEFRSAGQRNHVSLGSFLVEEDAARAYDKGARTHFGNFAALNFPLEGERSCL